MKKSSGERSVNGPMIYQFNRFAKWMAHVTGQPISFGIAVLVILTWLVTGPIFGFNDTWQLVINTATTIVTFLMVFLIQNTQSRDSRAMQVKLDELVRALDGAHNALLDLEELTEDDLIAIQRRYEELAKQARQELRRGGSDQHPVELGPALGAPEH